MGTDGATLGLATPATPATRGAPVRATTFRAFLLVGGTNPWAVDSTEAMVMVISSSIVCARPGRVCVILPKRQANF